MEPFGGLEVLFCDFSSLAEDAESEHLDVLLAEPTDGQGEKRKHQRYQGGVSRKRQATSGARRGGGLRSEEEEEGPLQVPRPPVAPAAARGAPPCLGQTKGRGCTFVAHAEKAGWCCDKCRLSNGHGPHCTRTEAAPSTPDIKSGGPSPPSDLHPSLVPCCYPGCGRVNAERYGEGSRACAEARLTWPCEKEVPLLNPGADGDFGRGEVAPMRRPCRHPACRRHGALVTTEPWQEVPSPSWNRDAADQWQCWCCMPGEREGVEPREPQWPYHLYGRPSQSLRALLHSCCDAGSR